MSSNTGYDLTLFFAALADRTRLRLLNLMRDGEVCVCFLADTLGTNDPKISRHLAYLKRADLVKSRRDGKWMHYSLNRPTDEHAGKLFDDLLTALADDREMQKDKVKLIAVCCGPSAPVSIQRAMGRASTVLEA
jgi:ArsR family transcriptional regulator, arsenate/arsenite/antimonite-responsive transcriptional repressor